MTFLEEVSSQEESLETKEQIEQDQLHSPLILLAQKQAELELVHQATDLYLPVDQAVQSPELFQVQDRIIGKVSATGNENCFVGLKNKSRKGLWAQVANYQQASLLIILPPLFITILKGS